jgi:hypothetical protein
MDAGPAEWLAQGTPYNRDTQQHRILPKTFIYDISLFFSGDTKTLAKNNIYKSFISNNLRGPFFQETNNPNQRGKQNEKALRSRADSTPAD